MAEMNYALVIKDEEVVALFHGEGKNFSMAAHVFMMADYGIRRVTEKEYEEERKKGI